MLFHQLTKPLAVDILIILNSFLQSSTQFFYTRYNKIYYKESFFPVGLNAGNAVIRLYGALHIKKADEWRCIYP